MNPESTHGAPSQEPLHMHTQKGENAAHFEAYADRREGEVEDEACEHLREEICEHYHIPLDHRFFVADKDVEGPKRIKRAFSVIHLSTGESYYIDGLKGHLDLVDALQKQYGVSIDSGAQSFTDVSGFLDPNGFPGVPTVAAKSAELGKKITWFVRYNDPADVGSPDSPIEIN